MNFLKRIAEHTPILLDGATGSELTRRAVDTTLPLWSARALLSAPEVLHQIHSDYLRAGAEIITANTFRTHRRSLAKGGLGDRAEELTHAAVKIARRAIHDFAPGRECFVAGSLAPLEDCYSPELVPPREACEREHAEMARHLKEAGVDCILVETMNTIREAVAAARAARATGLPVLASFVCRTDGSLFSGESVTAAAQAVAPMRLLGLLVNCTPAATIHRPFIELQAAIKNLNITTPPLVVGLYANIGHTDDIAGWTGTDDVSPLEYARLATEWLKLGANLVGGCCGTTPAHIAAVRMIMR